MIYGGFVGMISSFHSISVPLAVASKKVKQTAGMNYGTEWRSTRKCPVACQAQRAAAKASFNSHVVAER